MQMSAKPTAEKVEEKRRLMFPAKSKRRNLRNFGKESVFGPLGLESQLVLLLFSHLNILEKLCGFLFDSDGRILAY